MASKAPKKCTTTNLLPEAFAVDLYILEDEDMIRALGRDKFVDLSIHGLQGWQHGVSALLEHSFLSCISPHFVFLFILWSIS